MSKQDIPKEFICPITKKVMEDPMMSRHGNNFERSAILDWLSAGNGCCPVSGKPLRPSNLVSNKALQSKIAKWKQSKGQAVKKDMDSDTLCLNKFVGLIPRPPQKFICPLTKEVMNDPVMTRDGMSFERQAIMEKIEKDFTCPVSGKRLRPSNLVTNTCLQRAILEWQRENDFDDAENSYFMKLSGELPTPEEGQGGEDDDVLPLVEKRRDEGRRSSILVLLNDALDTLE